MTKNLKPPTLSDVARLAGVSVPTASRTLNGGIRGKKSGSTEARQRVLEAARILGYSVNQAAQATKDGRARTIALIVSDIDDYGSAILISGVMHEAERSGISVAVRTTLSDPLRELAILDELRGERHRAVLIGTSRTTDVRREAALRERLTVLSNEGTSVVVIGDNDLGFSSVIVDNYESGRAFANGLVKAGHSAFALVTGPETEITARDRAAGFLKGLADNGIILPPEDMVYSAFSRDGGYGAVGKIGTRVEDLDVIAAMSDPMAAGVIARLRECGVNSPGDVEVTGFDRLPMLSDVLPRYSAVDVPLEEFGEAALALALRSQGDVESVTLTATPIVHGAEIGA